MSGVEGRGVVSNIFWELHFSQDLRILLPLARDKSFAWLMLCLYGIDLIVEMGVKVVRVVRIGGWWLI